MGGYTLKELDGRVIDSITGLEKDSESVTISTEDGWSICFSHHQDCCESVYLEDYEGGEDLSGAVILSIEEVEGEEHVPDCSESYTWTFLKIETSRGGIWMRWLGESNGYYGETPGIEITRG